MKQAQEYTRGKKKQQEHCVHQSRTQISLGKRSGNYINYSCESIRWVFSHVSKWIFKNMRKETENKTVLDCTIYNSLRIFLFHNIDNSCLGLELTGQYLKFVWFSLEFIIQHCFRSGHTSHTPNGFGAPKAIQGELAAAEGWHFPAVIVTPSCMSWIFHLDAITWSVLGPGCTGDIPVRGGVAAGTGSSSSSTSSSQKTPRLSSFCFCKKEAFSNCCKIFSPFQSAQLNNR